MTGQLYEGCWGVTRAGEKKGPFPEKSTLPYCYPFFLENMGWREDGRRNGIYGDDPNDIIAIFATEAEADAYLAGEKPDPRHCAVPMPASPKPVTWPDGVTEMAIGPHHIRLAEKTGPIIVECPGSGGAMPVQARQLSALIKAAADYVEGRG